MYTAKRTIFFSHIILFYIFMELNSWAGIVINEIMTRPINQSTNGQYEFVELYNDGDTPVDISGYILTDSEDWADFCLSPAPTSTSDNEGFSVLPPNIIVPANSYFTLWHNAIPAQAIQTNSSVYSTTAISPIVFLDSGDQVTLLHCVDNTPVVVDSVDLSVVKPGAPDHNISIERVNVSISSSVISNWKYSKGISRTGLILSGYVRGGTPGSVNTVSCPNGYAFHEGECVEGNGLLVGTYNQRDYEYGWNSTRVGGTTQFAGFRDKMSAEGALITFIRDLVAENNISKAYQLEDSGSNEVEIGSICTNSNQEHENFHPQPRDIADDSDGADSVDFLMIGTHGNTHGSLTLYEKDCRAYINSMKLGDDARMTSLLGLWVCNTMSGPNESRISRWKPIFSGGLRFAAGFRGKHQREMTHDDDGHDFAEMLMDGYTIKSAFAYSMADWISDFLHWAFDLENNEPTVAASGRNDADCYQRLSRMTIKNMVNVERLRWNEDNSAEYVLCFDDISEDFWD